MGIQLDINQRLAVESDSQAIMVLAGPGAGKTRVICQRIIHLVDQAGADPGRIAAVTFTNRAADEMRRRLLESDDRFEAVRVGTFHSFALDIVKRNYEQTHFSRKPVVFDEDVQNRLIMDILRRMGLSAEVFPIRRLKNVLDLGKANLRFPLASDRFSPEFEYELREILIDYQKQLLAHNALDFSDMLLTSLELMQLQAVRDVEQARTDFLLIDEFQDINLCQYALILAICPPGTPIFAVADKDQTIYNWRGSSGRFIHLFNRDYHPEIIRLDHNWRCSPKIVIAARKLIEKNRDHVPQARSAGIPDDDEPAIVVAYLNDSAEEHKFVIKLLNNAENAGIPLSDVAILGRTHYMLDDLHQELVLNGIPVVRPSKTDAMDSSKELTSYFELTRSINDWDVENALRFPSRCLSMLDEIRILSEFKGEESDGLIAELKKQSKNKDLGPVSRMRLKELVEAIGDLPDVVADIGLSAALNEVLEIIEKRRSPLKPGARAHMRGVLEGIVYDPSLSLLALRDRIVSAKKATVIFAQDFHSLAAAMIVTTTLEEMFNLKCSMIPFADDAVPDPGNDPLFIVGLAREDISRLLSGTLLGGTPCICNGEILIPANSPESIVPDHRMALAAYSICSELCRPSLPHDPLEMVFLDLETTSTDVRRAEIVELAAARYLLDADGLRELNRFQRLVKPSGPIPASSTTVHGITDEMVKDADSIEEVLPSFLDFLGNDLLAGHNIAEYDLPIIRRIAGKNLKRDIPNPLLDTLPVARRLFPRLPHTLADLSAQFKIKHDDAHRALADVLAGAEVAAQLMKQDSRDVAIDFSDEALCLLAVSTIWDETSPDDLVEMLSEAAMRASRRRDGEIPGLSRLTREMSKPYRKRLEETSSVIKKSSFVSDESDDIFDSGRRRIMNEAIKLQESNPEASISDFLDYYALLTDDDCVEDEEAIRMMSLHSVKGLEFNTVIIVGLEQGNMPHYLALGHADRIDEERRLMYVGLTRASRKVYLISVKNRDGMHRFPSMFLEELPKRWVKELRTPKK